MPDVSVPTGRAICSSAQSECAIIRGVDTAEIQAAFDNVFDQVILFRGL